MTDGYRRGPRVDARLEQLAQTYELGASVRDALGVLIDVFATDEHAATTVRDPEDVVDRHVADGLTGLLIPEVSSATTLVDVGAGAGIPALVIAAARPDCEVVALDTVRKKTEWVAACAERMGLQNVHGVHGRAESWTEGMGRMDVMTARAVAPLGVLVEYAGPLLRPDGILAAWKGILDDEEWTTGVSAAAQLGMGELEVTETRPWPEARDRRIVVTRKVGPTPPKFPRREGMARKRPLR